MPIPARGKLIRPILIEVRQLDTERSSTNDEPAVKTTNYNPYFREPAKLPDDTTVRIEKDPIFIKAQVLGQITVYNRLIASVGGNEEPHVVRLGVHVKEFEDKGLLKPNGECLLSVGDRLVAYWTVGKFRKKIREFEGYEKMYLESAEDRGIGFDFNRNLFLLQFSTRDKSTVSGAY